MAWLGLLTGNVNPGRKLRSATACHAPGATGRSSVHGEWPDAARPASCALSGVRVAGSPLDAQRWCLQPGRPSSAALDGFQIRTIHLEERSACATAAPAGRWRLLAGTERLANLSRLYAQIFRKHAKRDYPMLLSTSDQAHR